MLNHEGYRDPTAYMAIYENKSGGLRNMVSWHDGDITKKTRIDGKEFYRVILKLHDRYATTLPLFDDECFENCIAVKADTGKKMYADTGKIAYTKARDLDEEEFVRALEEKELDKILAAVGRTLCIPAVQMTAPEEVHSLKKEVEDLRKQVEALSIELEAANEQARTASEQVSVLETAKEDAEARCEKAVREQESIRVKAQAEAETKGQVDLAKAMAERDVYKELYMQLLGKVSS